MPEKQDFFFYNLLHSQKFTYSYIPMPLNNLSPDYDVMTLEACHRLIGDIVFNYKQHHEDMMDFGFRFPEINVLWCEM